MPLILDPTLSGIISVFTTRESAATFGGPFNADTYFTKNGTRDTDEVDSAWLQAGQRTDADIRSAWRYRILRAGVEYVTLESLLSGVPDDAIWLGETADWGILIRGYEGRGEVDSTSSSDPNSLDGKMAGLRKRYEARLAQIRDGSAILASQAAAGVVLRPVNAAFVPGATGSPTATLIRLGSPIVC